MIAQYYSPIQSIHISYNIKVTLLQKLLADNEEMIFLCENNLPKDLKSKRSVAVSFVAKP